jgi:hypothetical protein
MSLPTRLAAAAAFALLIGTPAWLAAQAPPAGATFKCTDGSYSTAASPRGACSRHGGIAQTLRGAAPAAPAATPAPRAAAPAAAAVPAGARFQCADGTYSTAASPRGACSRHGGVAATLSGAAPAAAAPAATLVPRAPAPAAAAVPAGARFKCADGTYSTAASPRGACSRHGGIAETLSGAAPAAAAPAATPVTGAPAPAAAAAPTGAAPANATALCKDGTYSMSQHRSGTCSRHGGVERWLRQPPN